MLINFLYGKKGLKIKLPDDLNVTVLEPDKEKIIENPTKAIYDSFSKPLNTKPLINLLRKRKEGDIVIVVEDHTRPMPSKIVLDALIKIFDELNINDNEIKILISTGLHRSSTHDELIRMVGDEIINRFDILFHDANDDDSLENVGKTSHGNEAYLNATYVNAGFKIVTGYVEPHFFAGFSGGRKALVPGIAGKDTILFNHSANHIDSRGARFGILENNPIHEHALEVARMTNAKPNFCINVSINSEHKITKIASGNIIAVHNYLVQAQRKICFKDLSKKNKEKFDIVICGNGGYPLDMNLYQAVKSMAIGELGAKNGGIIISINECINGVGQDKFKELINCNKNPETIYQEALDGTINIPDVWEIQNLARILSTHSIYIVSSMKENEIGNIGLKHANDVQEAINMGMDELKKEKQEISILVLPKGPLKLPSF